LGDAEDPSEPFQVASMDITTPYSLTPTKNRYLLTFIDNFSKYVEAFPIPDVSAETCARVYATQIIARHGSGCTLITDRRRSFISAFFKETCKIMRIRKVDTSAYHAMSNGTVETFHKVLHDSMSHYVDSTGTNWDVVLPFFLMAYTATPHSTTKYSPFYVFTTGREMTLPTADDLKAKLLRESQNTGFGHKLENLKLNLRKAYEEATKNNRKAHEVNKKYYDRKAKERNSEVDDKVYLFCPAKKPGRCQNFRKFWRGLYRIVEVSDSNYNILDVTGKEQTSCKQAEKSYDQRPWKQETTTRAKHKGKQTIVEDQDEQEIEIQSRPIVTEDNHGAQRVEHNKAPSWQQAQTHQAWTGKCHIDILILL
jgi:transposase InsO family protein